VTVAGTEAVELVIPSVAAQIRELKHQRALVAEEVEKLLEDFPLSAVLMSMPGVGIKTAATILLVIGDGWGIDIDEAALSTDDYVHWERQLPIRPDGSMAYCKKGQRPTENRSRLLIRRNAPLMACSLTSKQRCGD
jgi:hypothetical protein